MCLYIAFGLLYLLFPEQMPSRHVSIFGTVRMKANCVDLSEELEGKKAGEVSQPGKSFTVYMDIVKYSMFIKLHHQVDT